MDERIRQGVVGPYQLIDAFRLNSGESDSEIVIYDESGTGLSVIGIRKQVLNGWIVKVYGGPAGHATDSEISGFVDRMGKAWAREGCFGVMQLIPNFYDGNPVWDKAFKQAGYTVKGVAGTFLVDLEEDSDVVFGRFKKGLQKNLRRFYREEGFSVSTVSDSNTMQDYLKIIGEARQREGLTPLDSFSKELKNYSESKSRKYLVAYNKGIPVAVQGVVFSKDVAVEVKLGISDHALQNRIYAGDYLKWEIMRLCCQNGIKIYDLAGVSADPKTDKERGIYEYKAKWGGRYVDYTIWEKDYSPIYAYIRTAKRIRSEALRLIRRG